MIPKKICLIIRSLSVNKIISVSCDITYFEYCSVFLFYIFTDFIMPKDEQSLSRRLKYFIFEFGEDVFSIDNVVLFCKFCEVIVDPKGDLVLHNT